MNKQSQPHRYSVLLTTAILVSFVAQAAVLGAAWQFQGPSPAFFGQSENVGNFNAVSGAVHTVVAHPTDPDILWIGAVNGGIWKTTNATAALPGWTPQTDFQPSLAISALVLDPTDVTNQTLVAGTGSRSSYGDRGGAMAGLLRTTDGGSSWLPLDGAGQLLSKRPDGLVARGSTIIAAIGFSEPFDCGFAGVFRSTDAGVSFSQLASVDAVGPAGLPDAAYFDLVGDPTNLNVLYTSAAYTDFCNSTDTDGIYKSVDQGATWNKVSDAAIEVLIDGDVANIEMAVGNAGQVYVGLIYDGQLGGLFRSGNGGATWTALDLPTTDENGTPVGLQPTLKEPGFQGDTHFSIAADPTNANVVYVGGDRQPTSFGDAGGFPNALGAFDYSGRLFRVDASGAPGSQVTSLTHCSSTTPVGCAAVSTTSNSAPHADSRDMVFDANGAIIEVDDGGVHRRTNPLGTGDWFTLMGALGVSEPHDIAYDSTSSIILTGTQDNGTQQQSLVGGLEWVVKFGGGDGGDVGTAPVPGGGQSVRYSSYQFLQGFRREFFDTAGVSVGTVFPALFPLGAGPAPSAPFNTPFELNAIDSERIVFGAFNGIFESFDQGETITQLTDSAIVSCNEFDGDPLAYGGTKSGLENLSVLYVAGTGLDGAGVPITTAEAIWVRTSAGGPLALAATLPVTAFYPTDIVLDSDDWETAFVTDYVGTVYMTDDAGTSWTEITGNLAGLTDQLHAIEFAASPAGDAVYVAGVGGVFQMLTATPGVWVSYGTGLPNATVWDLDYDAVDDVLVAAAFGRGSWLMTDVAGVVCGDGVIDVPETCDDTGESLTCDTDCTAVLCGDGWFNQTAGEQCDDGNMVSGDLCTSNCLTDSDTDGVPDDTDICPGFDDTIDADLDGAPDGCDNCPLTSNPGGGTAMFAQTVLAPDKATLSWNIAEDIEWIRGDLATVSAYGFLTDTSAAAATSISTGVDPASGQALYFLVKADCPLTTWSTGSPEECPVGSCPSGGRDVNLP